MPFEFKEGKFPSTSQQILTFKNKSNLINCRDSSSRANALWIWSRKLRLSVTRQLKQNTTQKNHFTGVWKCWVPLRFMRCGIISSYKLQLYRVYIYGYQLNKALFLKVVQGLEWLVRNDAAERQHNGHLLVSADNKRVFEITTMSTCDAVLSRNAANMSKSGEHSWLESVETQCTTRPLCIKLKTPLWI